MDEVEHEIRQLAAVAAGYVLKGFQFYVLDTGSGSLDAVPSAGDNHFAPAGQPGNDGTNGIIAPVTGALGFRDS